MVRTASTMLPLGTAAPEFDLPDTDGHTVSRLAFAGRPLLVIFLCNHCPFVKHVRAGLAALTRELIDRGVGVVGISSNDITSHPEDAPDRMREEKAAAGYPFAYLFDGTQVVAKSYHAACTPDFFLFDPDHRLAYRGQMDDSRPGGGRPVTGADLRAAADAVLAGRAVPEPHHPSLGCNIKWTPGNEPAYFAGG